MASSSRERRISIWRGSRAQAVISAAYSRSAMVSICREMGISMMKTSYSTIFNEGLDFTCALALRNGDLRGARPFAAGPPDSTQRLYPAVCSSCLRPIRLPFKPSLDRPVFCRFCLDARNGR